MIPVRTFLTVYSLCTDCYLLRRYSSRQHFNSVSFTFHARSFGLLNEFYRDGKSNYMEGVL